MNYTLVEWPWVQELMEHKWFGKECYLLHAFEGQPHRDSAYFVPACRLKEVPPGLITEEQRQLLLENGADPDKDHAPVVRLFMPKAKAQWLLSELDPEDPGIAFGLCDLGYGFPELGWVALQEVVSAAPLLGLTATNDHSFAARYPMSVYARAARTAQEITLDARLLSLAVSEPDKQPARPKPPQP